MYIRFATVIVLSLASLGVRAEISCEQYGAIAQEAVRQRDQGASLSRLLADVERGEMKDRYSAQELALIKDVIRASFNGTLSPMEVVEACKQGGVLVPSR